MEKIHASMMIEILGRPADHVSSALQELVEKLGTEKGVKVLEKTLHEPHEVENSKDLFTAFAEIDVEFDALQNYFATIFAYMPSHIEIISPEKISLSNHDLNELGNALTQRLHNYDAVTKNVLTNSQIILEKLKEVAPKTYEKLIEKLKVSKADPSQPN